MHGRKGTLLSVCCLTDGLDDASGMCAGNQPNKQSASGYKGFLEFFWRFSLGKGEVHLWHRTFAVSHLSQLQARVL